MLGLWYKRIIGSLSAGVFDMLSHLEWTTSVMYGAHPSGVIAKADIGELPAGRSLFSTGLWGLKIIRRKHG